jgi:DNA-binding transcriptional LysR family regulator
VPIELSSKNSRLTLELYQLRTFVVVAECKNISKASLLLNVTQPAVSGHLKNLEETLNLKLFSRSAGGVSLTDAGEHLLVKAQLILAAVAEFKDFAFSLGNKVKAKATVGTILDPSFIRLGQFMSEMIEQYPWVELKLSHGISTTIITGVLNKTLDAAFCMGHIESPKISSTKLTEMAYRVVAPSEWGKKIENASLENLLTLPWIRPPNMSPHEQMLNNLFDSKGTFPEYVVEADQEATIRSLVASGLGLGLVREDLAFMAASSNEVSVWQKLRPTTALSFIHLAERSNDVVIKTMTDVLKGIWLEI